MLTTVLLAPVPCIHLHSAAGVPELGERVAFGSSHTGVPSLPIGLPVFIVASDPQSASAEARRLHRPGWASWGGRLGAVVPAVAKGARSGQHPEPHVRPHSAKMGDSAFLYFWEVTGLHLLPTPRRIGDFKAATPFGDSPRWPVLAELEL